MKDKLRCPICKYHDGHIVSISSYSEGYYWLCPNCGSYSMDVYADKKDVIKNYKKCIIKKS